MEPLRLFTHPACLEHDTGIDHPESAARLQYVLEALKTAFPHIPLQQAPLASRSDLQLVHNTDYIDSVLQPLIEEYRCFHNDTVMSKHSPNAALYAAGSGIAAVNAVMQGETQTAFCAVRPPGHHAVSNDAMGFCFFNNIAIAAMYAQQKYGLERIAIVDFDVHHGNGTQDICENQPQLHYFSSQQSGLFPYSGNARERGIYGNIHNVLLPPGSDSFRFQTIWEDKMLPIMDDLKPQLVMISAGFDAHRSDPLADIMLETEDFAWITQQLRHIAQRHAQGRIVSTLEGGYNLSALAECVVAHVTELHATTY